MKMKPFEGSKVEEFVVDTITEDFALHLAQIMEDCKSFALLMLPEQETLFLAIYYSQTITRKLLAGIRDNFIPFQGMKVLSISGLAKDSREVWEVPEVTEFYAQLGHHFPDLINDQLLHPESRKNMLMCELVYAGATIIPTQGISHAVQTKQGVIPLDQTHMIMIPETRLKELRPELRGAHREVTMPWNPIAANATRFNN